MHAHHTFYFLKEEINTKIYKQYLCLRQHNVTKKKYLRKVHKSRAHTQVGASWLDPHL